MSVLSPYSASDKAPKALDIFSIPANQVAIQSQFYEDIRPVSQFQLTPLEFDTNLQGDTYTDLSRTRLFLKVRILKGDGTSLPEDAAVSPVNLLFHSLFKQVDLYLNRTLVSSSGDLYAYKSFIKTLFNSSSDDKSSALQGQLFFKDTAGFVAETNPNSGNFGLFERHQLTKGSKQFDLFGLPLSDFFQLDHYMVNGVHLRLLMLRNTPEFCLVSAEDDIQYQIRIEDAFLRLVKLKINPAILVSHSKVLKDVTAKYPFVKTDLKVANIIAGQNSFSWDMINSSYLPRTVIVAFVESNSLIGSLGKNPFDFKHFNLTQISVLVNGVSTPGTPIHANYDVSGTHGITVGEVLQRLYDTKRRRSEIGAIGDSDHSGLGLNRKDIRNGYAFYLFDLEPVLDDDMYFDLLKTGSLSLNAMFGSALTTNVSCLLYTESYGLVEIDESRVVRLA